MSRPVPTLRGWVVGACGVLALAGAGWFGRVDLLFAGLLLTLTPLAAMLAVAFDRPWLTVRRSYAPDSVPAGDGAQVRLEVRNESSRPAPAFSWFDAAPAEVGAIAPRAFPSLAPGDAATLRYTARAGRRGAYLLGPLRVQRSDPFGLARCGYAVGESKVLLVTPRAVPLGRGGPEQARGEGHDPELVRHSIPSADEVIPRDYRPGDALRRVQWRASARTGKLMVRQEEQRSNPEAWVLLDTVHTHDAASDDFERAVELTASICTHLLELGYLVGVHETGPRRLSGVYELPGGDHVLLAQLAALEQGRENDGDYAGRLSLSLRAGGGGSPVFLVLVDAPAESWRDVVPLRRFADPAVAFLMSATARTARASLEAGGWVCVDADAGVDAPAAWARAAEAQRGRARAGFVGGRHV
ncbi:DUF58 domain-containing protein [Gryllotalpicola reticulitermitis]|uniref:DUF58 domain-containing protein n=1 Tax=Gryllotalpicola reticulitermitis TaxID=1184153 RepID=A0ABV8Q2V9_9MICO